MNNDATSPMPLTPARTCHNTARLEAKAAWTSSLVCGGNVESSGMSAYMMAVPCGTD